MNNKTTSKKYSVRLREKDLADDNKSLYLDIWYKGRRKYEFLKLYILKPVNALDRINNKKTYELAENIRAKRQLQIQDNTYGFTSDFKQDTNFIEYFKSLIEKRKDSEGNFGNWQSAFKHLTKYCPADTTFRDVDYDFVEGFKEYLMHEAKTKSSTPLSINSTVSYLNKLKATLNQAFDDRIIIENPAKRVRGIKADETHREYLTLDELKKLAKTQCRFEVMKRAFLFSCLTGIRWSDVQKMIWSEVQRQDEGWKVIFRQKKTRGQEYLDISNQAREYLGEQGGPEERVFTGLRYSAWHNMELQKWVMKAGINKNITFHCSRHTFAILQLDMGTDIYTVSKLLGHKELKTTQIYAKVLDLKKREAMSKIPDINI
jgi:integrase